jgi:hypothetical protein
MLLEGDIGKALDFFIVERKRNDALAIESDFVLLSRIFSECGEHYKALDYGLRNNSLAGQIR